MVTNENAKVYFAVFNSLTEEGLEISRKFFKENEDLINYREIEHPENFFHLRDILSKQEFCLEDFETFNYDRTDDEDDDLYYILLHLRHFCDIISLGQIKERLTKEFEEDALIMDLVDEAIKLYGLNEAERSILHLADHRDDEKRMLDFIRNFKQTAWERDTLQSIIGTLLMDFNASDYDKLEKAISDEEVYLLSSVDNYSYPESVLPIVINKEALKKVFFSTLRELAKEQKEIEKNSKEN